MQARLSFQRFPSTVFALVFALIAALILGGVAGYTLMPAKVTQAAPHVVVLQGGPYSSDSPCVFVGKEKQC
jgi:hypothetical protein